MDVSVLSTSDFEVSLNPSVMRASPLADNFLNVKVSDGFVACGGSEFYGDETRDVSLQHIVSKKVSGKKINKCVCKQDKPLLLVVGEVVPLNEIVLTNALTLVGQFGGRKISAEGLHCWVSESWL